MRVELGLDEGLYPWIREIESSGVYSNFGPQVSALEAELATLLGCRPSRVVTTANATLGIHGAISVMEPKSWVLPSWTFVATAHAAMAGAGSMEFGEVDPVTWMLNPSEVHIGEGAVITAPFGSRMSVGEEWNHVSAIVVDAAAAVGAFPQFSETFRRPWAAVVSMHATKVLGIGEGGFAVFSDDRLADRFRQWTNFGFFGSRVAETPGSNAKLSEIAAAIARYRLSGWERERASWIEARRRVHEVGSKLGINPSFSDDDWVAPYWIAEFSSEDQKSAVVRALTEEKIGSRDWWSLGCHAMSAFSTVGSRSPLTTTEHIARKSVGLPFFRGITGREVARIGEVIARAMP